MLEEFVDSSTSHLCDNYTSLHIAEHCVNVKQNSATEENRNKISDNKTLEFNSSLYNEDNIQNGVHLREASIYNEEKLSSSKLHYAKSDKLEAKMEAQEVDTISNNDDINSSNNNSSRSELIELSVITNNVQKTENQNSFLDNNIVSHYNAINCGSVNHNDTSIFFQEDDEENRKEDAASANENISDSESDSDYKGNNYTSREVHNVYFNDTVQVIENVVTSPHTSMLKENGKELFIPSMGSIITSRSLCERSNVLEHTHTFIKSDNCLYNNTSYNGVGNQHCKGEIFTANDCNIELWNNSFFSKSDTMSITNTATNPKTEEHQYQEWEELYKEELLSKLEYKEQEFFDFCNRNNNNATANKNNLFEEKCECIMNNNLESCNSCNQAWINDINVSVREKAIFAETQNNSSQSHIHLGNDLRHSNVVANTLKSDIDNIVEHAINVHDDQTINSEMSSSFDSNIYNEIFITNNTILINEKLNGRNINFTSEIDDIHLETVCHSDEKNNVVCFTNLSEVDPVSNSLFTSLSTIYSEQSNLSRCTSESGEVLPKGNSKFAEIRSALKAFPYIHPFFNIDWQETQREMERRQRHVEYCTEMTKLGSLSAQDAIIACKILLNEAHRAYRKRLNQHTHTNNPSEKKVLKENLEIINQLEFLESDCFMIEKQYKEEENVQKCCDELINLASSATNCCHLEYDNAILESELVTKNHSDDNELDAQSTSEQHIHIGEQFKSFANNVNECRHNSKEEEEEEQELKYKTEHEENIELLEHEVQFNTVDAINNNINNNSDNNINNNSSSNILVTKLTTNGNVNLTENSANYCEYEYEHFNKVECEQSMTDEQFEKCFSEKEKFHDAQWRDIERYVESDLYVEGYAFVQRRISCMCVFNPICDDRYYCDNEVAREQRANRQRSILLQLRKQAAIGKNPYFLEHEVKEDVRECCTC